MDDFDLESRVKAVRVPSREEEYWEAFPERVLAELRSAPPLRGAESGLWWSARLALACLMLGFCVWQSRVPQTLSHALRRDQTAVRRSVEHFHDHLARLMRDEHGLQRLVEDPS